MLPNLKPPYYTVVFTSLRTEVDDRYGEVNDALEALAAEQSGFLGVESVREEGGFGISVSYWRDRAAIEAWARELAHREAKAKGVSQWFAEYSIRIAKVEEERGFRA